MNKFTMSFILFAFFIISLEAQADRKGNGGDALVCKDSAGNVSSVELFDYYEARVRHKLHIDLGPKSLSVDKKIDLFLNRLEKRNPNRARIYRHWWSEFEENLKRERNVKYIDIPDQGSVSIPTNCDLEQVAIQETPTFPTDKLYRFNQDIVDLMDNDSKAGLILHEIVYREALLYEHQDSVLARYFHSLIASDTFALMSLKELFKATKLADMRFTEAHGFAISTSWWGVFYHENALKSARALPKIPAVTPRKDRNVFEMLVTPKQFPYSKFKLTEQLIDFYENGYVKEINTSYQYGRNLPISLYGDENNKILLDNNETIIKCDEDGDILNLEDIMLSHISVESEYFTINLNFAKLRGPETSKFYSTMIRTGNFTLCDTDHMGKSCNETDAISFNSLMLMEIKEKGINWSMYKESVHLKFKNFRLTKISVSTRTGSIDLRIKNQLTEYITTNGILEFHDNMNVKKIELLKPTMLLNEHGQSKTYSGIVELNKTGWVIER